MLIVFLQTQFLLTMQLWRQRSSDQDDHKGKKSYNETPQHTELLLIGWFIESIWTPRSKYIDTKNQLADIFTQGNFTRDEWNHLLCLFNISHFSSINKRKAMSKRTQEDACEESHSKTKADYEFGIKMPCKGSKRTCLDCIWKPGENQIWKSERTSELVKCAANSLRGDLYWALAHQTTQNGTLTRSGLLKCGNLVTQASTARPVDDRFVIDDDMDSWHRRRIEPFSKIPFIPERRWMTDCERCWTVLQKIQCKTSTNVLWFGGMFMSSTLEASIFMWKNCSDNLHSIKHTGVNLALKQMFWDIWTVDIGTIGWDFWSVSNQLGKFSMETVISGQWWKLSSVSRMQRFMGFPILCYVLESESEPNIKYCLGTTVGLVQRFITIQNFGHNWRRTDGIRVEYFPRIHYIAACRRSPKAHEQDGRTRTIPRTNYLHVDVQWHHMVN